VLKLNLQSPPDPGTVRRIQAGEQHEPTQQMDQAFVCRHRRPARRPAPGLTAYKTNSSNPVAVPIKDISSTGVYLETPERWIPGDLVSLSLQKDGPPELSPERRFDLKARTVRWATMAWAWRLSCPLA